MNKFAIVVLFLVVGSSLTETYKECFDKCMNTYAVEAMCWHECKHLEEVKVEKKPIMHPAVVDFNKNDKCYDDCYKRCLCTGETIEAVIYHLCHFDCQNNCVTDECPKDK